MTDDETCVRCKGSGREMNAEVQIGAPSCLSCFGSGTKTDWSAPPSPVQPPSRGRPDTAWMRDAAADATDARWAAVLAYAADWIDAQPDPAADVQVAPPRDEDAERKPLVYVAGPITGDPFGCVRQAMAAFQMIRHAGCVPFLPQLSVIGEMVEPQDYEAWMAYDLDVIDHCDALYRLRGESPGADREVEYARSLGLPVLGLDGQDWPALCALTTRTPSPAPPAPAVPVEQAGRRELDELRAAAADAISLMRIVTPADRRRTDRLAAALAAAPSPTGVQDGPLAASRCQVQEAGSGTCTWPSCGCGDA